MKLSNAFLILSAAGAFMADPVMAADQAPASEYNNAFFRYEINSKTADTMLAGASAFSSLGDMPKACESLNRAIGSWDMALKHLANAEATPVSPSDEARMSADTIKTTRETIIGKRERTKEVIAKHCPAS